MKRILHPAKILASFVILSVTSVSANADDLFDSPMDLFKEAMIPALNGSERGTVQTTWRGFSLRADNQSQMKNEGAPSESGLFLNVEVRDSEDAPQFSDVSTLHGSITHREIRFPAIGSKSNPSLTVTFQYGPSSNAQALKAIEECITQIKRKAGQPETRPN